MQTARYPRRSPLQQGAALAESVAGLALVLTLGVLIVETAQWQMARQLTTLALLEAARAGATEQAQPQVIARAFERALIPLLASGRGTAAQAGARVQATLAARSLRAGLPAWRIHIDSPRAAHVDDFATAAGGPRGGAADAGGPALSHGYQFEQHQAHRRRWPAGRGPRSGQDIFDANRLALRLRYLHQPLTPLLGGLLRAIGWATDGERGQAMRQGLMPIHGELAVTMQSGARRWPPWHGNGGAVTGE